MITTLLLILIIFIPSFYVYIKKNVDIERVIPCTIFSIILIIYVFGLLNLLKFGVYLVFVLAFLFFCITCITGFKNKKSFKTKFKVLIKPSMVFWIIGIIFTYFYYRGRMLASWDEFSHWGDVVKMMYHNNIYSTNPASLSAASAYPPIMPIFQYFVENLSISGFNEHYLFSAYHIFIISLIIPFIKGIKWKEIFRIIIILVIIIIAPTLFFATPYFYYNMIYIDPFLGIMFGYLTATVFLTKKYKKFDIINISLALFTLTLLKDIAPVFSFIVLSIVFLNIVFGDKCYKELKKINKKNILNFLRKTKPIWIFLLVVLISYISWKVNVFLNAETNSTVNSGGIIEIIKGMFQRSAAYRGQVIDNYLNRLYTYNFTNFGNIYMISSVLVIFSILIYNKEKVDDKQKSIYSFSLMFIGEAFYVVLMLILYLLMFSQNEAVGLASFERYIGIYLTAIVYFIVLITIYRSIEQKSYKYLLILLIIVILNANIQTIISNIYYNDANKINTQNNRKVYSDAANGIKSKIGSNKKYKFYIIIQNTKGAEKWILRYEMRDMLKGMNEGFTWSLGNKYSENDIWTLNISRDEFKKILYDENYDYVYLYSIDKQFKQLYSELFDYSELENYQLYKVDKKHDKLILVK